MTLWIKPHGTSWEGAKRQLVESVDHAISYITRNLEHETHHYYIENGRGTTVISPTNLKAMVRTYTA